MSSFSKSLAPKSTSILLLTLLAVPLSACTGSTAVFLNASSCLSLIPNDWKDGVPGADRPADSTAGAWVAFANAQTGQLDKANSRTSDLYSIVSNCEARDQAVAKSLEPKPWWKVW